MPAPPAQSKRLAGRAYPGERHACVRRRLEEGVSTLAEQRRLGKAAGLEVDERLVKVERGDPSEVHFAVEEIAGLAEEVER